MHLRSSAVDGRFYAPSSKLDKIVRKCVVGIRLAIPGGGGTLWVLSCSELRRPVETGRGWKRYVFAPDTRHPPPPALPLAPPLVHQSVCTRQHRYTCSFRGNAPYWFRRPSTAVHALCALCVYYMWGAYPGGARRRRLVNRLWWQYIRSLARRLDPVQLGCVVIIISTDEKPGDGKTTTHS